MSAIQVKRIEPHIYHLYYGKGTSIEDIMNASVEADRLAKEANDSPIITINELEPGLVLPFDIHNFKRVAEDLEQPVGAVVIGATLLIQILARMIDRLTPLRIVEAKNLDEAVVAARKLLAGESVV